MPAKQPIRYKDAGVDIDAADQALDRIKKHARKTFTRNVLTSIGSFGAGFRLSGWTNPVLVSSADGVGTKLKVAFLADRHDTVGEDLVNHCVNDIMVQGAAPLFFLDYLSVGKMDTRVVEQLVSGLARGCKANGCALIGGETAEMPGIYTEGEYDLAGFIVGAVEQKRMLTGSKIKEGDILLGLPSTGLHTNGYSLARKLLFDVAGYKVDSYVDELGCTVGDELLKVHKTYCKAILGLSEARLLKGAAHITGGGISDNLPRILPSGLGAKIHKSSWDVPPVFPLMKKLGKIPPKDYRRTFNLGIGMILAVPKRLLKAAKVVLEREGEDYRQIGEIVELAPRARARVIYE
jgi:phosphoribosylformylglycinamidine cyclo-ligase